MATWLLHSSALTFPEEDEDHPDPEVETVPEPEEDDFFTDYNYIPPSYNIAYMRNILKRVNDLWNDESESSVERVSKVKFKPDEELVTVTYIEGTVIARNVNTERL